MTTSGKIITWTIVISVLAISGYVTYVYIKKKKEEEAAGKPKINIDDAKAVGAGVGAFIANLFKKDPITDGTGGLNYELNTD